MHVNTFYLHINLLVWGLCKCISPWVLQVTHIAFRVTLFRWPQINQVGLVASNYKIIIVLALWLSPVEETWNSN